MTTKRLTLALTIALICSPAGADNLANAVSAAAHAACQKASDSVRTMFPGLQQTWNDNKAAQQVLAEAQEKLHLASVPLQNSDCSGAAKGTPACLELDAAYNVAREQVLLVEPKAQSTARTYAINLSRYQAASNAATDLCTVAIAADAARARGAIPDTELISADSANPGSREWSHRCL